MKEKKAPVTAGKINLKEVESFLEKKGYKVEKIWQPWRHVVGKTGKGGKELFFKMASTEDIGRRTRNEIEWNEKMSGELKAMKVLPVKDKGEYQGLPWLVVDYLEGKPLAEIEKNRGGECGRLMENLPKVVAVAKEILNYRGEILEKEKIQREKDEGVTMAKVVMKNVNSWIELLEKKKRVIELRELIVERLERLQLGPCMGDFVPWHMIEDEGEIYLIDGEIARIEGVKFYDVAYFYHRVFTKLEKPEMAEKFMDMFLEEYPISEDDRETLRLILAQRLIGGYMDAQYDELTSEEQQDEMAEKLLKGEIV